MTYSMKFLGDYKFWCKLEMPPWSIPGYSSIFNSIIRSSTQTYATAANSKWSKYSMVSIYNYKTNVVSILVSMWHKYLVIRHFLACRQNQHQIVFCKCFKLCTADTLNCSCTLTAWKSAFCLGSRLKGIFSVFSIIVYS